MKNAFPLRRLLLAALVLPLALLLAPGAGAGDEAAPKAAEVKDAEAEYAEAEDAEAEAAEAEVAEAEEAEAEEAEAPPPWKAPWPEPLGDPRRAEVRLPAAEGWDASLVLENGGVGVWAVKSFPVFDHLAVPELVALDDYGRLHLLVVYSGKWSGLTAVNDQWWLGGLVHEDLDPRVPGRELYAGSKTGHLWQVVAHPEGALESRILATLEGREIHTLAAGDLDPAREGPELLAFTNPGGAWLLERDGDGATRLVPLGEVRGRVRDAVVLPAPEGTAPEIATVSRDGTLTLFRFEEGRLDRRIVYAAPMGLGRIAAPPGRDDLLYATHDDGVIVRLERQGDDWRAAPIYLGPQGPRGIVADRLGPEGVETVAIYGYSKKVELLTRGADGWSVETLFLDQAPGHWLAAAEVDGRNATRELALCGFGGRVILLAREPGYGLDALASGADEDDGGD